MGTGQGTGKHCRRARGAGRAPRNCSAQRVHAQNTSHVVTTRPLTVSTRNRLHELCRWYAARRQAERRKDADVRTKHAQEEKARRQLAKSASQTVENPELAPARGHAAQTFLALPLCDRPGCHEHPASSPRNLARYCCPVCRQAVRNVLDRERKWFSRSTPDGRKRRAIEYQAARRRRVLLQGRIPNPPPSRPPPR